MFQLEMRINFESLNNKLEKKLSLIFHFKGLYQKVRIIKKNVYDKRTYILLLLKNVRAQSIIVQIILTNKQKISTSKLTGTISPLKCKFFKKRKIVKKNYFWTFLILFASRSFIMRYKDEKILRCNFFQNLGS